MGFPGGPQKFLCLFIAWELSAELKIFQQKNQKNKNFA